jgi:hypothetical protein
MRNSACLEADGWVRKVSAEPPYPFKSVTLNPIMQ